MARDPKRPEVIPLHTPTRPFTGLLPGDETLWTAADLARRLKIGRTGIYKLIEREKIPHFRIGGLLRFEPAAVRAWLATTRGALRSGRARPAPATGEG